MSSTNGNGYIRLVDLTKGFKEGNQLREVLIGASASFRRGEFIAIIGKSGSGKSTLLNLISGIDRMDGGEITIDGLSLTRLNENERTLFRRNKIGFVFQFFNLIPTLSVLENVTLPLELAGTEMQNAQDKARVLLAAVGLADRLDAFPDRLSGGEQQRVAIARALVHDPLLVLADEPTGNLDADTGAQVLTLLDQLTRKVGKNLIMVTHSRGNASIADRIFTLQNGRLVEVIPQ
jgi:putative ABC transport system ATP-binding protein